MSNGKGITSFETEKTIKNSENKRLKENVVGIFPLTHINRFIISW